MELPDPATNGLCIIDFEKNRDYQFFVGTKNGNIYGFEKTGEPVEGWNPRDNIGVLGHDIEHFQVGGKDYILALTNEGKFHVLGRDGHPNFEAVSFEKKFLSPPGFQTFSNSARMVLTDQSGRAKVFNIKGKHFNLYVGADKNNQNQFQFADIVGDDRKDYISLSNKDLSCYYYSESKFSKAFDKRFDKPQHELFTVKINKEKDQIGTLNRKNKRINLLKNDGKLVDGFPLAGTTKFTICDLFDTKEKILVVALDDSIYTCKIQ